MTYSFEISIPTGTGGGECRHMFNQQKIGVICNHGEMCMMRCCWLFFLPKLEQCCGALQSHSPFVLKAPLGSKSCCCGSIESPDRNDSQASYLPIAMPQTYYFMQQVFGNHRNGYKIHERIICSSFFSYLKGGPMQGGANANAT